MVPADQNDFICSICEHDCLNVAAKYFCRECGKYFCCTCEKVHSRIPSTQGHVVVSGANMPRRGESYDRNAHCCHSLPTCVVM